MVQASPAVYEMIGQADTIGVFQVESRALADCGDGQRVRVAGLVVVHQACTELAEVSPPTAKGHHFLTLEDEDGMINVMVRPAVFDRYRHTIHTARLLLVEGVVQCQDGVISFLAGGVTSP